MDGFRQIRKIYAIWLIAGLLAAVSISQTHAHFEEDPYEVDRVCSICLVGENVSHFIVTATVVHTPNSSVTEQTNHLRFERSPSVISYYQSRAPPLNL